uniref:Uncharacterized protein n=1 Tax=Coccidioides posadasii RMSCC 3488 TaxID=454284 RepID=A0A0J6FBJ6_COCPO|nr:hypothetical protein CPAG_06723 [Coccidioides posadasii RMSCC 3488]
MSGNECIRSKTNIDRRGNDIDIPSTVRVSSWLHSTSLQSRAEPKLAWTRLNIVDVGNPYLSCQLGPLPIAIPTWSSVGPEDELSSVTPHCILNMTSRMPKMAATIMCPSSFGSAVTSKHSFPQKGAASSAGLDDSTELSG